MEENGFEVGNVRNVGPSEATPIHGKRHSTPTATNSSTATATTAAVTAPQRSTATQDGGNVMIVKPLQARSSAQLQQRIERRIAQAKKSHSMSNGTVSQQPRKSLMPINRLHVPGRVVSVNFQDDAHQPLVTWESESSSSEDEFEFSQGSQTSRASTKEISKQLQKDGFNLDLTPDDEDLDLIPPIPFNQRCACCQWSSSSSSSSATCSIQ